VGSWVHNVLLDELDDFLIPDSFWKIHIHHMPASSTYTEFKPPYFLANFLKMQEPHPVMVTLTRPFIVSDGRDPLDCIDEVASGASWHEQTTWKEGHPTRKL